MRQRLSLDDLKQIALRKIREHSGCHDVADIPLCPVKERSLERSRAIRRGVGGSDKIAAGKAALYLEQEMTRGNYELEEGAEEYAAFERVRVH